MERRNGTWAVIGFAVTEARHGSGRWEARDSSTYIIVEVEDISIELYLLHP